MWSRKDCLAQNVYIVYYFLWGCTMSQNELNILWPLLAIATFLIYNVFALSFSGQILGKFTKKKWLVFLVSICNIFLLFSYVYLNIPFPFIFFIGTVVLFIEFTLLSKAPFIQKLFGAAVFFLHIGITHELVIVLFANIFHISIISLFKTTTLYLQSLTITCSLLIIVLFTLTKFIKISEIRKVSNAKNYTKNLLIVTLAILSLLTLESFLIIRAEEIDFLLFITVTTSIFCYVLFYFFFLYSINFINMHMYKRKNDKILDSHHQLIAEKQRIEHEIARDSLTGLYTKKIIFESLANMCDNIKAKYAVLFIDLNGLKKVNDTYGHEIGDDYICTIAQVIKESIREIDLAARIGGDEFISILTSIEYDDAQIIVNRINENIEHSNNYTEYECSVCIGTVYVDNTKEQMSLSEILRISDERMREKKKAFYSMNGDSTI